MARSKRLSVDRRNFLRVAVAGAATPAAGACRRCQSATLSDNGSSRAWLLTSDAQNSIAFNSGPIAAVERPVLNSLGDVRVADRLRALEVGNGARYFEDTVVGASAQTQPAHGAFQQALTVDGDVAVLAKLAVTHLGITVDLLTLVTPKLALASRHYALANPVGGLSAGILAQLAILHSRHVDVDVDPVEQRSGDLGHIALDDGRGTGTLARGVIEVAAWVRLTSLRRLLSYTFP